MIPFRELFIRISILIRRKGASRSCHRTPRTSLVSLSSIASHIDMLSRNRDWLWSYEQGGGGLLQKAARRWLRSGWRVGVIQILLSARDNSRYTSIRQCRTIAEREAARNRAVSLTTCNGTAVSIGCFLLKRGTRTHTHTHVRPPSPHFSRVFLTKRNERAKAWRRRAGRGERENGGGETSKGKVNLREQTIREPNERLERASTRCDTGEHPYGERMRARPMDATSTIRAYCTRAIENNETMRRS